jgi:hypothetical protein
MKRLLVCAGLLAMAVNAYTANSYVSSSSGDDVTGTGSFSAPYATIQKAANVVTPGDTVFVRGGVYHEGVTLKTSGKPDSQIVFAAYPNETPVLDGSVALTGWTRCASAADCGNNPLWASIWYVPLPTGVGAGGVGIYENGTALKEAMFPNQPDSFYNDQVEYFKITPTVGYTETTIVDTEVFTQADPQYWVGTKIWIWGGNNNVINQVITRYIPAEHKVIFTPMGFAVNMQQDRYALVNHVSILDTAGEYVVDTTAKRIYLMPRSGGGPANTINRGLYKNGFNISAKNYTTIQGFAIRNFSEYSLTYSRDGAGIINYSTNTDTGLVLRDNRITTIQGNGISIGGCVNCIIERNYVGSVSGKGIFNDAATNSIIRENEVYQSSSTAIGFYRAKACQVLHNYVHECNGHHGNGLTFYLGCHNVLVWGNRVVRGNISLTIQQSEAIYVLNNVLYNPDSHKYGIAVWSGALNPLYPPDSTVDSLVFMNNMVYSSIVVGSNIKNAVIRNNIVGGYCQNTAKTWDQAYNLVFEAAWCQPTGDTGNIVQTDVDLIFTDYDGDDFTPLAASPAINTGTDVSAYWPTGVFPQFDFNRDLPGHARPYGGAMDMGPYEWRPIGIADDLITPRVRRLNVPTLWHDLAWLKSFNRACALYDAQGNVVYTRLGGSVPAMAQNLTDGVYFLTVAGERGVWRVVFVGGQ